MMPLDTEVGLGPGDIVLDEDPAPPHGKGHSSPPPMGVNIDGIYKKFTVFNQHLAIF